MIGFYGQKLYIITVIWYVKIAYSAHVPVRHRAIIRPYLFRLVGRAIRATDGIIQMDEKDEGTKRMKRTRHGR